MYAPLSGPGSAHRSWRLRIVTALAAMALLLPAAALAGPDRPVAPGGGVCWLTILHNNDGESQLLGAPGQPDFGGVARFKTLADQLRTDAMTGVPGNSRGGGVARDAIMVTSGDNFLAGPEWSASLDKGVPFFDSIALDLVAYDAMIIGNHDFDFGPDTLVDFIGGFGAFNPAPPFLSANLDFSGEPGLQALVDSGQIAASTTVDACGREVGIVGATTPALPFISSPRNVVVDPDVAAAAQLAIDELTARGVNVILFVSHLQSIQEDLALLPNLSGVDVAIAGGGDELLANPDDLLIPGDESEIFGPYPLLATNADGDQVPVVTTNGSYRYIGRLIVGFNPLGKVVRIDSDSGPVRVSGVAPDAVAPDPTVETLVTEPVAEFLEDLATTVVGDSQVPLDGLRSSVRTTETNLGDLLADALLSTGTELAGSFGVPVPDVAVQNGGGMRNDSVIPAGPITELDTFSVAPFPNFVSIVEDISRSQFKEILENAVSRVEFGDGRFAQVAGFSFEWDPSGTAQVLDADSNVVTPGSRIVNVTLDSGPVLVANGVVQPGADLTVATIDFLARGGDQYPFRGAPFTTLGVSYQRALSDYIQVGLAGVITAADYPEGGSGRIVELP